MPKKEAKSIVRRSRVTFRPLPASNIPKVIPPRSVVILASVDRRATPDWMIDRGRIFRIGYYNRGDGLNCIWLVNDRGEYEQTTDRPTLLQHFVILQLSDEHDLFGDGRPALKPLKTRGKRASILPGMLAR
jgi:hypothetical protein